MDGVSFVNSGAYSCEVIADTTFHTLIETKEMLVIGEMNSCIFLAKTIKSYKIRQESVQPIKVS